VRHLKGTGTSTSNSSKKVSEIVKKNEVKKKVVVVDEVVESFDELGISDEVMGAVKEIDIEVPTEIQCIGIPAILDGKSVVLGSHTGSGKTLAYLLPLVQVIHGFQNRRYINTLTDVVTFNQFRFFFKIIIGVYTIVWCVCGSAL
jgi:superfamily II DNA/RNA helicase